MISTWDCLFSITVACPKRPKKANFAYFLVFFGPGTSARGFSRPWHRISRQKCRIWMRMCRDMTIFVIFEKFESVLHVLERFCAFWKGLGRVNFQAVMKSAASAASLGTKSRKPRSRGVPGRRGSVGRRGRPGDGGRSDDGTGHSPGSWFP